MPLENKIHLFNSNIMVNFLKLLLKMVLAKKLHGMKSSHLIILREKLLLETS